MKFMKRRPRIWLPHYRGEDPPAQQRESIIEGARNYLFQGIPLLERNSEAATWGPGPLGYSATGRRGMEALLGLICEAHHECSHFWCQNSGADMTMVAEFHARRKGNTEIINGALWEPHRVAERNGHQIYQGNGSPRVMMTISPVRGGHMRVSHWNEDEDSAHKKQETTQLQPLRTPEYAEVKHQPSERPTFFVNRKMGQWEFSYCIVGPNRLWLPSGFRTPNIP